jgi:hypothetical protein
MSGDGRFKGVLEGDEVERFLAQFVVSDAERARMLAADPKANVAALPKSSEQVLHDVKQLWQEKGFQSPNDLKAMLIDKYLPDADPKVKDYIRQIESARGAPEATTGYLGKEHAYIATGLAHLYAKETGRPIAMVEADFSNMGGTNDHFTAMLKAERPPQEGQTEEQISRANAEIKKQGMHMTDQAVGLLCKSLTSDLAAELPTGAKIVPIRTGGDEIRIIVTGVEDKAELARLTAVMHAGVEQHVAAMGLQDHAHLKAPNDAVRNGFGVALTTEDMRDIKSSDTLIQELDGRINAAKRDIGLNRLGEIDEATARETFRKKIESGELPVPPGQTAEQVINAKIEERAVNARAAAQELHGTNPMHNSELQGGSAGFNSYVEKTSQALNAGPLSSAPLPGVLSSPEPIGANRPEGIAPLAPLEERWNALAAQHLESEGVKLSPADQYMLKLSVGGLSAQDPSAQTFMPKIVGPTVEAYAAETEEFRKQWNPQDPAVKQALSSAGLKSVGELTPQAMAVSFHNLAGLNSALGHHQADLVLRHMSNDIIEHSLNAAGIPPGPPKPYAIAHHGGGNFSVMIQPGGTGPDGKPWFASPDEIHKAQAEIEKRTAALNEVKIADFLATKGVPVTDEMKNKMPQTFADIQDPKMREVNGVKGGINGLLAESASAPMQLRDRDGQHSDGFGFMGRLRNAADAKLDAQRNAILLTQAVEAGVKAQIDIKDQPKPPKKGPQNGGESGGSAPAAPKKPSPPPAPSSSSAKSAPAGSKFAAPVAKEPVAKPPAIEKPALGKPVVEKPAGNAPVAGKTGKVQGHAATAVGVAQVGLDIMEGKYGQALQGAATQVALNPNTYKAAGTLAKEGGTVAKALGFFGKKIPIVGAVVTAGFVLYEVGSNVYDGKYAKAVTAAGAGAAEALGNVVGFGLGDAAREGVRETIVRTAGEEYAPNKSGIRTLIEGGVEVGSKFINGDAHKTTEVIATNKSPAGQKPVKPPTMG